MLCLATTSAFATIQVPTSITHFLPNNSDKAFNTTSLFNTEEVACPPNSMVASQPLNYVLNSDNNKYVVKQTPTVWSNRYWVVAIGPYSQKTDTEALTSGQNDIKTVTPATKPYVTRMQDGTKTYGACLYEIPNNPKAVAIAVTQLSQ